MELEKLQRIFQEMQKTADQNPDAEDDLELVLELLPAIGDYVKAVAATEQLRMARPLMDADRYRTEFQQADQYRTSCHNAMMNRINTINRLCTEILHIPPLYEGDSARTAYADWAMTLMEEVFRTRTR